MKQQVRLFALLALMMLPMGVMGQVTLVSDNASNYGGTWSNSSNFGFGLSAWDNTYNANTGGFIGNPSNNGMGTSGIGTTAFGMFATGNLYMTARRPFATSMKVGDVLTFYWAINWDANGGAKGFDLKAGGTTVFNVNNGGSAVIGSTAGTADGSYGTNPMLVTLTRTSSSEYSFTMTRRSDGSTFSTTVSSALAVDRLEFYIGNQNDDNGNRNMYFNAITITNASASTSLTGTAGWRLLSSPVSGSTYADVLGPIWTQGATGSDSPDNGTTNVFWSEGSTTASLVQTGVTNLNTALTPGRGFAVYVYNDDNYTAEGGTTWPKTLSVTGTENAVGATYTPAHGSGTQYAIGGNPFASTIDWDNVTKGDDVANSVWVWNPGTDTYDAYNAGNGLLTGGLIAPFQGFWFEYDGALSGITFPVGAKSTGGTFRGKEAVSRRMVVRATDSEGSNHAWVSFRDGATLGEDDFDAVKFTPLSADYIQLFTMVSDKAHDINSLPIDLVDALEIPLGVSSTRGGTVTLDLTELNLPDGWAASLRDNVTGVTVAVDANFSYSYESSRAKAAPVGEAPHVLAATAPRFTLIVDPLGTTSTENGKQTTENFQLEQNYPNPFNPSTVVGFRLSVAGHATLKVYDVLGREVAVLVNGTLSAGSHSVNFDASNLTSGVYMYKLEAGGMSQTKRMTLVK